MQNFLLQNSPIILMIIFFLLSLSFLGFPMWRSLHYRRDSIWMGRLGSISVTAAKLSRVLFRNFIRGTIDQLLQVQLVENTVLVDLFIYLFVFKRRWKAILSSKSRSHPSLSWRSLSGKAVELRLPPFPAQHLGEWAGWDHAGHRIRVIQGRWGSGDLLGNFKSLRLQRNFWRKSSHGITAASVASSLACWVSPSY